MKCATFQVGQIAKPSSDRRIVCLEPVYICADLLVGYANRTCCGSVWYTSEKIDVLKIKTRINFQESHK